MATVYKSASGVTGTVAFPFGSRGGGADIALMTGGVGSGVPPASDKRDYTRFRSFAERYVCERASSFKTGQEKEDAWQATLDARTIFEQIGEIDRVREQAIREGDLQRERDILQQQMKQMQQWATPPVQSKTLMQEIKKLYAFNKGANDNEPSSKK